VRSLQGAFSRVVEQLIDALTRLRIYVEGAIDFPDEDVDFLADGRVAEDLARLLEQLDYTLAEAQQGSLLREGMRVVIAGRPNAGKSSLLNALSGEETAIVTAVEGTTRDVLREQIQIDGMPVHIIDTAGLRDSSDEVEQIGIERAWQEIEQADRILLLVDSTLTDETDVDRLQTGLDRRLPEGVPVTVIRSKADLSGEPPGYSQEGMYPSLLSPPTPEMASARCVSTSRIAWVSRPPRKVDSWRGGAISMPSTVRATWLSRVRYSSGIMARVNCWPRTCARPRTPWEKSPER